MEEEVGEVRLDKEVASLPTDGGDDRRMLEEEGPNCFAFWGGRESCVFSHFLPLLLPLLLPKARRRRRVLRRPDRLPPREDEECHCRRANRANKHPSPLAEREDDESLFPTNVNMGQVRPNPTKQLFFSHPHSNNGFWPLRKTSSSNLLSCACQKEITTGRNAETSPIIYRHLLHLEAGETRQRLPPPPLPRRPLGQEPPVDRRRGGEPH